MLYRHAGDDLLWREVLAAAATSRDRDVDETLVELSKEILDIVTDAGVYREAASEISQITCTSATWRRFSRSEKSAMKVRLGPVSSLM